MSKGRCFLEMDIKKLSNWFKAANFFEDINCKNCKKMPACMGGCILHKLKSGKRNCTGIENMISGYI